MANPALQVHRFHPAGLDPITIYVEAYRPGASRVTVQCYAQAWTAYWGAHGARSVEHFIASADADYVADGLMWGNNGLMLKAREKHHRAYLIRIVSAMQEYFRSKAAADQKGGE